jgi:ferredoxin-NADP reductase
VIGGLFLARKIGIQRADLVFSFLITYFAILIFNSGSSWLDIVRLTITNSAILYFAFFMLTEPSTTPPKRTLRIMYGALVAVLYGTSFSLGPLYASPELALVTGNIFSFLVSNKVRYRMKLVEKKEIAPQTYGFKFEANYKVHFEPGQFLEWTLGHAKADLRGNRRYFTIASAPTENHVDLGIKFYENSSTFKKALTSLNVGDEIFAGQLSGDFTLPKNPNKKLAFIAGGIGITPFRSMLKYLADKNEKRDIVLFYAANTPQEFAYKDILENAGAKIVYKTDRLTAEAIMKDLPDYLDRTFYISGPHGMVDAFEKILKSMGIPRRQIKIDFFPGYV